MKVGRKGMEQKSYMGSTFANPPLQHLITEKVLKHDKSLERIIGLGELLKERHY